MRSCCSTGVTCLPILWFLDCTAHPSRIERLDESSGLLDETFSKAYPIPTALGSRIRWIVWMSFSSCSNTICCRVWQSTWNLFWMRKGKKTLVWAALLMSRWFHVCQSLCSDVLQFALRLVKYQLRHSNDLRALALLKGFDVCMPSVIASYDHVICYISVASDRAMLLNKAPFFCR